MIDRSLEVSVRVGLFVVPQSQQCVRGQKSHVRERWRGEASGVHLARSSITWPADGKRVAAVNAVRHFSCREDDADATHRQRWRLGKLSVKL